MRGVKRNIIYIFLSIHLEAVVSSRTTAAGNERFFAIKGYALSTPIFQRVQFELSESSPSSSTSGEESNSDDEKAVRPVKRRRIDSSARASNIDQLKTWVSFYEVADKFPPPQWRETEEKEEKELKEGEKKNSHQVDLVNQYKRRVAACKSFWGLSEVDEFDLERLIELTADPSLALDSLEGGGWWTRPLGVNPSSVSAFLVIAMQDPLTLSRSVYRPPTHRTPIRIQILVVFKMS